jgi:putative transposase
VVDRRFVLGEEEKAKLVECMRTYERFGGLRLVSYCIMSNHFHILVEVLQRPDAAALPDDAWLVAKVRADLGDKLANDLEWQLELHRKQGNTSAAEELRDRWFGRMWDISAFMKVFKHRFTQWFNGRHARRGTLWEDRFRSELVEGRGQALRAMAAYIELNPVRANAPAYSDEDAWGHPSSLLQNGPDLTAKKKHTRLAAGIEDEGTVGVLADRRWSGGRRRLRSLATGGGGRRGRLRRLFRGGRRGGVRRRVSTFGAGRGRG